MRLSIDSAPHWDGLRFQVALTDHYAPILAQVLADWVDPDLMAEHYYEHKAMPTHLDKAPLIQVFDLLYKDAYLCGMHAGALELKKAGVPDLVWAAAPASTSIDWGKWAPGSPDAAALLQAKAEGGSGLADLLGQAGITIKGIESTTMDRMSTSLSESLAAGLSTSEAGRVLNDNVLGNPARAQVIAQTEMSRAMTVATLDQYQANGVASKTWILSDGACELCQENESDGEVGVDDDFTNGDPPVHPGCVCAVAPVLADGSTGEESTDGDVSYTDLEGAVDMSDPEAFDSMLDDIPEEADAVPDWEETHGEMATQYADFIAAWTDQTQDASEIGKQAVAWATTNAPAEGPMAGQGLTLAQLMDRAPVVNDVLYRGMGWDGALPTVGDEIQLRPSSFSYSAEVAQSYADTAVSDLGAEGAPVLVSVESGARGLPVKGLTVFGDEQEVISGGRFTVVDVQPGKWNTEVTVRQL